MKNVFLIVAIWAVSLLAACKKIDSFPQTVQSTTARITTISPENPITGSIITIEGVNLGTDLSQVIVTLDEKEIPVLSVNSNSIKAKIPNTFIISGNQTFMAKVQISGYSTNTLPVKITFIEPKGWFYAATIPRWFNGGNLKNVKFPSDSIGYVQNYKEVIYKTTNGGLSWEESKALCLWNLSFAVYDNNNAWTNYGDDILSTFDGQNWRRNRMDTITTIPNFNGDGIINGLYMSSPNKGQMMKPNGRLYYINGSFAREDIITEHVSIYSNKDVYWLNMSNIDEFNLIISGHATLLFGESPYWRKHAA